MPTILGPAAVSNEETERKAQEIVYAFYKYYFSNTARTLAGVSVTFPALTKDNYLFNQQEPADIVSGPHIHTIFTDLRPTQVGQSALTKRVHNNAILTVYARVKNPSTGLESAEHECRFWGDRLKQIFESGTQALAQLGIHNAKIRRGPVALPSVGQSVRMLVVTAQLQYAVGY